MSTPTLPESAGVCGQSPDSADKRERDEQIRGLQNKIGQQRKELNRFNREISKHENTAKQARNQSGIYSVIVDRVRRALKAEREESTDAAAQRVASEVEAMRDRLRALEWRPTVESLPTEDDANDTHDVEWSDGKDIWQGFYHDHQLATHWRPITLP